MGGPDPARARSWPGVDPAGRRSPASIGIGRVWSVGTPGTDAKVSLGETRGQFKSEAGELVHRALREKRFRNSKGRVPGAEDPARDGGRSRWGSLTPQE